MMRSDGFGTGPSSIQFGETQAVIDEPKQVATGKYMDDVAGRVLIDSLAEAARRLELD